jgi:Holliday junction resolvase RusA-like endonuclease
VLPFELFVFATPASGQARRKKKRRDWREEIRAAARRIVPEHVPPVKEPIRVRIGYYYSGRSLDVDNILKAMLDGLEHVVYTNDNLIVDLIVSKRTFADLAQIDMSKALMSAVGTGADFIHLMVDRPTTIEVLR